MDDEASGPRSAKRMTASDVGRELGVHRSRVLHISAEELPYTTSPGGKTGRGRRWYTPEDVAALKQRREAAGRTAREELAALREDVGALREDVGELRQRLSEVERKLAD